MTSLAGLYEWLVAGKAASRAASRRGEAQDYRIRALPREEILLYVKEIDNTKVVRLTDRKDTAFSLGMAASVVTAATLLIALLMPGGYSLLASRRMERLKSEKEQLVNTLRELRVKEARMVSAEKLEEWAGTQFVEPTSETALFAPPTKGTVAKATLTAAQ